MGIPCKMCVWCFSKIVMPQYWLINVHCTCERLSHKNVHYIKNYTRFNNCSHQFDSFIKSSASTVTMCCGMIWYVPNILGASCTGLKGGDAYIGLCGSLCSGDKSLLKGRVLPPLEHCCNCCVNDNGCNGCESIDV